jgi:hypothetical protein
LIFWLFSIGKSSTAYLPLDSHKGVRESSTVRKTTSSLQRNLTAEWTKELGTG